MKKDYCTMWPDQMFGVDLSDLCYDHDAAYREGSFIMKLKADFVLATGIAKRAFRAKEHYQMGIIAASSVLVLAGVLTAGTVKWYADHWCDNLR